MSDADDFNAALEPIRREFIASLPDRFARFDVLWERISAGTATHEDLVELRRGIHSLTGCGLTFGFPSITDTSRPAEQHLDPIIQAERMPDDAERATFILLMQAIRDAARDL